MSSREENILIKLVGVLEGLDKTLSDVNQSIQDNNDLWAEQAAAIDALVMNEMSSGKLDS